MGANDEGSVLEAKGDFAGARQIYEQALAADEKALGLDHPAVANDLASLGCVLQEMGDYRAARRMFELALAFHE